MDEPHGYLPPRALDEPATLLARPSALATSRSVWVMLTAPLAVLAPPNIAPWLPWWVAPLLIGCVLDAGAASALAWAMASLVAVTVLPPGGAPVFAELGGCLAVVFVVRRLAALAAATAWAPTVLGALASLTRDAVVIVCSAASTGRLDVDLVPLGMRAVGTAMLTALVLPGWLSWASRERSRGRA